MKELNTGLYVGCDADVEEFQDLHPDGVIIHAAKERWHRDAVGYTGRGAPKDHPEYLVAERGDELMLNLVDAPKPEFIPRDCFDAAFDFFSKHHMVDGLPILIHCNQGLSRGPGVALYCLWQAGYWDADLEPIDDLLTEWEDDYDFELGAGVRGALLEWFE